MDIFLSADTGQGETRSATTRPRVAGVRSTNTVAYGEPASMTRSDSDGVPVYELTLANDDATEGFAVVGGEDDAQSVLAYVPVGSIADTTFNAGLAMWFREMYVMGRQEQSEPETRANVYQDGWESYNDVYWIKVPDSDQYIREMTTAEKAEWWNQYSYSQGRFHKQISERMKRKWSQEAPYNDCVPVMYTNSQTGTTQRCRIGCTAVAVGQIMADHKWAGDRSYNWSLLGNTPNTPDAAEVAGFLYDIALELDTSFTSYGAGSTATHKITPALERMGYSVVEYDYTSNLIEYRIEVATQYGSDPVLVRGDYNNGSAGHIWIVDAYLKYRRYRQYPVTSPTYQIWRYDTELTMYRCIWGWGGLSDGWYYNYNPKQAPSYAAHTQEYYYYFNLNKRYWLITPNK